MKWPTPLIRCTLLKRYKRFLVDVKLEDGSLVTAHVANTGAMTGCAEPGSEAALSYHPGRGRKLPHSLELVKVGKFWVGVNTALPNHVVEEAVRAGRIGPLRGYREIKREQPYGQRSRIDLLLMRGEERCYVEVKSVTLRAGKKALFPDAVSSRGTRHLEELRRMALAGQRALVFFLVNRGDCSSMAPAEAIDPVFARALRKSAAAGVEVVAYRTAPDFSGIQVQKKLPVQL